MTPFLVTYFGLGVVGMIITFWYSGKRKVSSTLIEGLGECITNPIGLIVVVACWPLFFLNDIFSYIPKQSKERLDLLKTELKDARLRRAVARERALEEEANSVVGLVGITTTHLRLAGNVRVGDTTWSAISESGFIPAGSRVMISAQRHQELTVRLANHGESVNL